MKKPGSLFLLAKCLKNTCWKSDILSEDDLLKMSLFHKSFLNMLLVKTNYLVYP